MINRFPLKIKALHNNNIRLLPTKMKHRNKIVIIVFKNPLKLHNLSLLNRIIKIHYMVYKIVQLITNKIHKPTYHNKFKM